MANNRSPARINRDLALAQKLGINSTPATVIVDNRTGASQLVRAAVINLATRESSLIKRCCLIRFFRICSMLFFLRYLPPVRSYYFVFLFLLPLICIVMCFYGWFFIVGIFRNLAVFPQN